MKPVSLLTLLFSAFLLVSCGSNELTVSDAWARPALSGGNSAVYLVIDNPTSSEDSLLSADCDIAAATELHMSTMGADGAMSMQRQENIPLPASSQVSLQPGGLHIMLINLSQELVVGESITLTLHFQTAGDLTLAVPILEP